MMATWHQQQSRCKLYHDTQWTIVTDTPGDVRSLWLEPTEKAAKDRLAVWEANGRNIQYCYVLKPARK